MGGIKAICSVIVLVNLILHPSSAQKGFGQILNDADVLSLMNGVLIQDHDGIYSEPNLYLKYHLTKNSLDNITGNIDDFAIKNGRFSLRVHNLIGIMKGKIDTSMDANITYGTTIKRTWNVKIAALADYLIKSEGAEANAEMLIRDLSTGDLVMETCSASVNSSKISLQNVTPVNIQTFTVRWLTQNLNKAITSDVGELYCNAISNELGKGSESEVFQEILRTLIRAILSGK